jgi:hypothetical protein
MPIKQSLIALPKTGRRSLAPSITEGLFGRRASPERFVMKVKEHAWPANMVKPNANDG